MEAKILYVEDDETLGFVTCDSLRTEGYIVTHCHDGHEAKKKFRKEVFDLCIIDVMLPKMDGFQLAEYIRDVNTQIPIIFVTAKSLKEDKIHGLKIGADDYITKPFSIEELILKINIFLKRKYINQIDEKSSESIGEFIFDYSNLKLEFKGSSTQLTQREGDLLHILSSRRSEILKRKDLLEKLWGKEDYFLGRSMDVFISRLRKHLSPDPSIKIENIHGVGFRLSINNSG